MRREWITYNGGHILLNNRGKGATFTGAKNTNKKTFADAIKQVKRHSDNSENKKLSPEEIKKLAIKHAKADSLFHTGTTLSNENGKIVYRTSHGMRLSSLDEDENKKEIFNKTYKTIIAGHSDNLQMTDIDKATSAVKHKIGHRFKTKSGKSVEVVGHKKLTTGGYEHTVKYIKDSQKTYNKYRKKK